MGLKNKKKAFNDEMDIDAGYKVDYILKEAGVDINEKSN